MVCPTLLVTGADEPQTATASARRTRHVTLADFGHIGAATIKPKTSSFVAFLGFRGLSNLNSRARCKYVTRAGRILPLYGL
jgi:hypothetical protein